jgi:hypothetical protein
MKSLSTRIFKIGIGLFLFSGCLEDKGEKQSKDDFNNSEFVVEAQEAVEDSTETPMPDDSVPPTQQTCIPPKEKDPYFEVDPAKGLFINNGAAITNNPNLNVSFDPPFDAAFFRLTENTDCSGGEWISYNDAVAFTPKSAGVVNLSVKFQDWDNMLSDCYTKQIIVDQKGPDIVFNKYPSAAVEEGSDVEIIYTLTDSFSKIKIVSCEFSGISKACPSPTGVVKFPAMAEGEYKFKVSAIDELDNYSEKEITFKVTALYKNLVKSMRVIQNQKVDILFVIDNSGSMEYEQKSMASRVRNFLDVVHGLDWQIGITTTDPRNSVNWGDGQLVALKGLKNKFILNSAMSESESRSILSNTLQRGETGSGLEQGILATYRMLERSQVSTSINAQLIREGAHFAVVLISDEDESANELRNDPNNLVKFIQETYKEQKNFSFHSIIARPGDKACLSSHGAREGIRFETMAKLTGGMVGDVCATDYAEQMKGVAEGVRRTLKSITLSCEPVINEKKVISITKDGQIFTNKFSLQGLNLIFENDLPQGEFEIKYTCLK